MSQILVYNSWEKISFQYKKGPVNFTYFEALYATCKEGKKLNYDEFNHVLLRHLFSYSFQIEFHIREIKFCHETR